MTKPRKTRRSPVFKVLLVDDHPAVREALALRLSQEKNLKVCGEAADSAEAMRLAKELQPDVAILDIRLKSGDGLDLMKRLKARHPKLITIIWSIHNEMVYAERALRAGAMAYLTKEQPTSKIIEAIRNALVGKLSISSKATQKLLKRSLQHRSSDSPIEVLSDRELAVFRMIGEGLKTAAIALRLHLSVKTVETYRDRIRSKMGFSNSSDLARHAFQWVEKNS